MDYRYSALARDLATRIDERIYNPGEKLPSVRILSTREGVSPATVVSAYRQLELEGYVESRPRSGFVVRARHQNQFPEPSMTQPPKRPKPVTGQELMLQLLESNRAPHVVNLGATVPDPEYLPTRAISQAISAAAHEHRTLVSSYALPSGLPELRQQIASRMANAGCIVKPEHILITAGCQEALYLSLKTMTEPGDIVAIESPTYYGLLQTLEALGLKALEIPTDPRQGISIEALQLALEQWPVKACVLIPNFSNPLGCLMPDNRKKQLIELVNQFPNVTIIEDDIYGDLGFDHRRPCALKHFDTEGKVIYCASLSKTLTTGLRIGWVHSEQHFDALQYQKLVANCATGTINQLAVSRLLQGRRYDRHLRGMQIAIAQSVARMQDRIGQHFPDNIKITRPAGGLAIWLELSNSINAIELCHLALEQYISIAPGPLFSPTKKYQNCIRLSCAVSWNDQTERAIVKLGELVGDMS